MEYRALRTLSGEYGHVHPGQIFDAPQHLVKKLERLEARGIIERHIPRARIDRKAYVVTENKAIMTAPENKALIAPLAKKK